MFDNISNLHKYECICRCINILTVLEILIKVCILIILTKFVPNFMLLKIIIREIILRNEYLCEYL